MAIPQDIKDLAKVEKYLLRKSFDSDNLLPDEVLLEKKKDFQTVVQ